MEPTIETALWILLLLALVGVPAAVGAWRREAPLPDWLAVAGASAVGIVFAVLAATTHQDGVSTESTARGLLLAWMVGAAPAYLLYLLGRVLARRRIVLVFACLLVAAPLAFGYFLGWIIVLDFVHCPPDAYECPL